MEPELSSEMKTDVSLLLECLKFQMDNPEAQKAALVTIYSICQGSSHACDYFRGIGGLMFISNLAKCSTHSVVKEAALFTLGVLAENNVFCQQTLCSLELFEDICLTLSNEEASVNLKRLSVYIFLVLVSNNKNGQSFARESGCINMLLILFREILLTCNLHLSDLDNNQQYLLWTSVCSALCASANNPQNDENQKLCSSAFPQANNWLQEYIQPEIVRPICSLVGLTVANNSFAQGYFSSVGGLDTLAGVLVKLVANQDRSSSSKLAVVVTKTLDACIADNPTCVNRLSKQSIITTLIRLLSHETLDPEDRFCVILTLGHCTESCEANQHELVKSHGLPLMIHMLAESQDEELRKAIIFVLQNCIQITKKFSVNLRERSPSIKCSQSVTEKHMDEYWKKAEEMLHKIEYLQQQHNKGLDGSEDISCGPQALMSQLHSVGLEQTASIIPKRLSMKEHFGQMDDHPVPAYPSMELKKHRRTITPPSYNKDLRCFEPKDLDERTNVSRESVSLKKAKMDRSSNTALQLDLSASTSSCSGEIDRDSQAASLEKNTHSPCRDQGCRSNTAIMNPPVRDAACNTSRPVKDKHLDHQPSSEQTQKAKRNSSITAREKEILNPRSRGDSFKNPTSVTRERNTAEHIDVIDKEVRDILATEVTKNQSRCSGCITTGTAMNSRNCSKILHDCLHLCERHQVILQAEEQHKKEVKKLYYGSRSSASHNYSLTPLRKGGKSYDIFHRGEQNRSSFLLTPIKKLSTRTSALDGKHECCDHRVCCPKSLELAYVRDSSGQEAEGALALATQNPASSKVQDLDANEESGCCSLHLQSLGTSEQKKGQEKQTRRIRKDFTESEIAYLLDGVQKFGHRWNSILWSYPFQRGRRNVDLAKKYKKLKALS